VGSHQFFPSVARRRWPGQRRRDGHEAQPGCRRRARRLWRLVGPSGAAD